MSRVYFTEEGHKYFSSINDYKSVSSIWKEYFKEFNGTEVSGKKAIKDLNAAFYEDLKKEIGYKSKDFIKVAHSRLNDAEVEKCKEIQEKYLKEWDEKREFGTRFHKMKEELDKERGYRVNPFTDKKHKVFDISNETTHDNISLDYQSLSSNSSEPLYVPEALITSFEHLVAGQADMLFVEKEGQNIYVDIDDWKTDTEIEVMPKSQFKYLNKMNFPYDHMYDTNYWKYCLKISTYAYMLELNGFQVRNLSFTHIEAEEKDNGEFEILNQKRYEIPYKKFEVQLNFENLQKK